MGVLIKLAKIFLPTRIVAALRVLKDPDLHLSAGKVTYNQDRLLTSHNCDFMNDKRFSRAYEKGKETGSWGASNIHWRAFVACWAAEKARMIDGDFVECGVNKGGLSRTVIEYINLNTLDKKFYLLDTYEGLSEKYISDEEKKNGITPGGYEECYNLVKKTFSEFDNVLIIKGTVPDTLTQVTSEKVCYLSIDMNCLEPEIEAAEFFWDKLVSGAVMLLDDYGWAEHILQKRAFDEFAKRKDVMILSLPTGQGLIIKP
jgi:O-methyltransferase